MDSKAPKKPSTRKAAEADKSPPATGALVAAAGPAAAQAEPLAQVNLEQAAEAQGVDVLGLVDPVNQPDWLLAQFDVKARAPAGFWRCGVQFLHSSPTRVFVVSSKAKVPADHDCTIPCCYLTAEEARRVYNDQWLTVVLGSEVIKG